MFVIVYFFLDGFFEFEYKSVELVFKWMMQKINFYNDIFSQVFVVYIVKEVLLDDSFDVFKKGGGYIFGDVQFMFIFLVLLGNDDGLIN